jgi:hypothetical protein
MHSAGRIFFISKLAVRNHWVLTFLIVKVLLIVTHNEILSRVRATIVAVQKQ